MRGGTLPASGRHYRKTSRGASQGFGQRLDAGGLGFDQPELADVIAELVQDLLCPDAAGQLAMAADQAVQVLSKAPGKGLILGQHGVVGLGNTLEEALLACQLVEKAAQIQLLTLRQ